MYKCRNCGGTWTEIPPDAVEISATRRGARLGRLYRFGGAIHDLRLVTKPEPPIIPNPNPPGVLVQEVQALEKLPEIIIEAEIEDDESELKSLTILSAAFGRVSKRNSRR